MDAASKEFQKLVAGISAESIQFFIDKLTSIPTRFHTSISGKQVADFLVEEYQKLALNRNDIAISTFDHGQETPQKSLIVRIEGRTRPDEIVILGSHIDSVNWRGNTNTNRAPGADDNASGTATNFEIFRVMMANGIRPERTLEIHAYAAEEIGLVGSQDIAQQYKRDGRQVVAMVQHDMTLWKPANTADKIWFVSNNTDTAFNSTLGKLIDMYVGVPWEQRALSGGSSDHASWRRAGFATSFPFENPSQHNPAIHTARDTTAQAPYFDLAAAFAKLGLVYVLHFAGA
jgi:leucyl aminopeptidase